MSRTVTLVVVDATGAVLGALPPLEVQVPYWPEVADVVAGARVTFGLDVTVLRLLATEKPIPHGGAVTYLAEVKSQCGVQLGPVDPAMAALAARDDPHRTAYARPGGPQESLLWASAALAAPFEPHQQRTWNLSAIWRLDRLDPAESVWLKQVPAFFSHEPAVLAWLANAGFADLVPAMIAAGRDPAGGARMLLRPIGGTDLYGASAEVCGRIAEQWHRIQAAAVARLDDLVRLGVPDRRADLLSQSIRRALADREAADPRLARALDAIDENLAAVAACGVPNTLVHGDLHSGNVRGTADGPLVILDWGDCFLGHPAFDIVRLTDQMEAAEAAKLLDAWARRWRSTIPGCEPIRAVELIRPILALRAAAVYAEFVANIERAEHPYHASDVDHYLEIALYQSVGH